jgi:hypothetical protein
VHADAGLETEVADGRDDCRGAADGAGGSVECREQAIPGSVDLAAAKACELGADEPVEMKDAVVPDAVVDFGCVRGRADNVDNEQGCEYAVGLPLVRGIR